MNISKLTRTSDNKLPAYAWPGGYPIIYIDRDCSVLCADCATKALDDPIVNALEYDSPEWKAETAKDNERAETLTEALRDFNRWIYKALEKEYEYLTSDEAVEESIRTNAYEFTKDGYRA